MAASSSSFSGAPMMQPDQYDSPMLGSAMNGSLPSQDGTEHIFNPDAESKIRLVVTQEPLNARQAVGKEKDRKPIDPPPIVKLMGERQDRQSPSYYSPYYFAICDLVTEDHMSTKDGKPLTNALVGTRTSSIHHLKDNTSGDGGFFVFGDLGVKLEGRFRLCFDVYDRDDSDASEPIVYHVARLFSRPFRVFAPKDFPGMSESTILTRAFWEQGIRLRLRKDSQAIKTRKRNRRTAEDLDASQKLKRRDLDRSEAGSHSSHTVSPPGALVNYTSTPDLATTTIPQLPSSQAPAPTSRADSPGPAELGTFLQSPAMEQFRQYPPVCSPANFSSGAPMTASTSYSYPQGYITSFSSNTAMNSLMGTTGALESDAMMPFNSTPPAQPMQTSNAAAPNQMESFFGDLAPRGPEMNGQYQFGESFMAPNYQGYQWRQ